MYTKCGMRIPPTLFTLMPQSAPQLSMQFSRQYLDENRTSESNCLVTVVVVALGTSNATTVDHGPVGRGPHSTTAWRTLAAEPSSLSLRECTGGGYGPRSMTSHWLVVLVVIHPASALPHEPGMTLYAIWRGKRRQRVGR
jgi:hypothetical protein